MEGCRSAALTYLLAKRLHSGYHSTTNSIFCISRHSYVYSLLFCYISSLSCCTEGIPRCLLSPTLLLFVRGDRQPRLCLAPGKPCSAITAALKVNPRCRRRHCAPARLRLLPLDLRRRRRDWFRAAFSGWREENRCVKGERTTLWNGEGCCPVAGFNNVAGGRIPRYSVAMRRPVAALCALSLDDLVVRVSAAAFIACSQARQPSSFYKGYCGGAACDVGALFERLRRCRRMDGRHFFFCFYSAILAFSLATQCYTVLRNDVAAAAGVEGGLACVCGVRRW